MFRPERDTFHLGSRAFDRSTAIRKARMLLWLGASIFILFLPLGRSFREAGSLLALLGLGLYYALDHEHSNLKRLGRMIWPYVLLLALVIFKALHTIDLDKGLNLFGSSLYGGFLLFFVGLELVRKKRDLKILVVLFVVMSCYEGLDGVYQYVTGADFFYGEPVRQLYADSFRLTGSFVRVGNILSISLVAGLGLAWVLPDRWPRWRAWLATALILSPGLFLLIFTRTRSSYMGLATALLMLWIMHRGLDWRKIVLPLGAGLGALLFGPRRISLEQVMRDGRIVDLWPFAWKVFQEWPLLGAGVNAYNPAFRSLGFAPSMDSITIPHPHNVYLQFLAETGLIGFVVFMVFLIMYAVWFTRRVLAGLRQGGDGGYWALLSVFACAYIGYLATAVSAHSFFSAWWLGLSMLVLGVTVGGCLAGESLRAEPRGAESPGSPE